MIKLPASVQRINLTYYTLIVVVLGVPLWWYTTDTYRATLPHSQIEPLADAKILIEIPVVVCFNPHEVELNRVEKILILLKPFLLIKSPKSGRAIYDISLSIAEKCGSQPFSVILTNNVNRSSKAELSPEGLKISLEKVDRLISDVAGDIVNYVDLNYLHNHILAIDNPSLHSTNQDVRNAMAVSTSYNVLVSVVNPDPAAITLDYDLVQGTKLFLEPFLSQLGSELGAVSYQTQVIRYVTLPTKPFKTGDKYYIIENNLPHLINPIESKLGTSTSNDINLIIYLLEEKYCPLFIKTSSGQLKDVNSFLSPQFGAVILYDHRNQSSIDYSEVFRILLPQLKQLLGARGSVTPGISPKEKYLIEARTALTHIMRSIDTLNSLIRLVDSIPNMVIGDHIADQVALSLASLSSAMNSLSSGNLSAALHHSSQARDAAETSFSDPSILALLYFPDDQKFAIYIPLFLPVGLPLVVAYLDLVKKWRKTKDVKVD